MEKLAPQEIKAAYLYYLEVKIQIEDWHAVQDIAVDLQVLEARHPELRPVLTSVKLSQLPKQL